VGYEPPSRSYRADAIIDLWTASSIARGVSVYRAFRLWNVLAPEKPADRRSRGLLRSRLVCCPPSPLTPSLCSMLPSSPKPVVPFGSMDGPRDTGHLLRWRTHPLPFHKCLPRIGQRVTLFIHGPFSAFFLLNHNHLRSPLPPKTVVPFGVDLTPALHSFSRSHFLRFFKPLSTFSRVPPLPSVRPTPPPPSFSSTPTTPPLLQKRLYRLEQAFAISVLLRFLRSLSSRRPSPKTTRVLFFLSARSTPRYLQVRTLSLSTAGTRLGWHRTD
jgi:hypothetical protein